MKHQVHIHHSYFSSVPSQEGWASQVDWNTKCTYTRGTLILWLLPSSKNLSQCSAAAQEPSPDHQHSMQWHCCCLTANTVQTQVGESCITFGRILAKNCPRNSSESYFNRLGQEQRESFGAICHNFALQTRELHVLNTIRTLSQCPQHKLLPPPNALYTIISVERCKQHNLWCKANSWLQHANLQGEPGENRGKQRQILVLTNGNRDFSLYINLYFKNRLILFWGEV